ncbi:hypothetical protein H634G_02589 [Metarhizium anisopliae BRIP 53293]|uniref:Polyketide synthase-like methyltransferase domain-containing protein n=1 Tax=Metarhizium anisopliae BRIP 53293 TaxID=1291518 RepID=A0A0D9PC60_METAN|nr:hypothetical protein H634G_02589 [Metarhizium anisopliae BRIP 53293]KJK95180.1 hypothetical protein H633G_00919 [Metarhizium anisopliae BRIP 53284]
MTHEPTSAEVGTMYDQQTDLLSEALGGSIHLGYWNVPAEEQDVPSAANRMTSQVADRLALMPGQLILDVGCGNGRPALHIATHYDVHIKGITISNYQLELADAMLRDKLTAGSATFEFADAMEPLPFDAASFDGAYAIEALSHISDKSAALAQVARVLRPGGRLVIADLFVDEDGGGADSQALARISQAFELPTFCTGEQYQSLIEKAGLAVIDFLDVRDHVRPGYKFVAEALQKKADVVDGVAGEQLHRSALDLAQLEKLGYALITATRA